MSSILSWLNCVDFPSAADRGWQLEEEAGEDLRQAKSSHEAVGLAEQLGDLYCKVGSFPKALEAYRTQVRERGTSHYKTTPFFVFLLFSHVFCLLCLAKPDCVTVR